MSSRTITSVVTADTIALNAAVFGYAGHSILTPHQAIQQVWWTEQRIAAKVTREFIVSKLRPNEREQLNKPVCFGDGLTDDTYIDWILRKAPRLYFILVECGVSDQIFGIVDEAWEDEDLPIPLAEVARLALSYKPDEQLNKTFYETQFKLLLRPIAKHAHIDYAPNEVIPVEFVHKLPPAAALQKWSRIHLPKRSGEIFVRRKLSLGDNQELDPAQKAQFLADIETARSAEHQHIASIWASWTSKGSGFWMTTFVAEHTLKSFIEFRTAASLQKLSKTQRHAILLDWMHCLTDAIASLHNRGLCHGGIAPSNILVDASNHVAFSDIASLETFHRKQDEGEIYDYGAPENHTTSGHTPVESPPSTSSSSRHFFSHRRAKSSENRHWLDGNSVSTRSSDGSGSSSTASFYSLETQRTPLSPVDSSFPRRKEIPKPPTSLDTARSKNSSTMPCIPEAPRRMAPTPPPSFLTNHAIPNEDKRSADIFSLGCIFLEIISFMFKKKTTEFVKHRSTKHKNVKGKGSNIDSSFHSNIAKLASWMEILEEEARCMEDEAFQCIPQLFRLTRLMLSCNPSSRPSAAEVRERLFDTLTSYGVLSTPHCSGRSWDLEPPLSPATTASSSSRPSIALDPHILAFPYQIAPLTPPKSPPLPDATLLPLPLSLSTSARAGPPVSNTSATSSNTGRKPSYTLLPWTRKPSVVNALGISHTSVA